MGLEVKLCCCCTEELRIDPSWSKSEREMVGTATAKMNMAVNTCQCLALLWFCYNLHILGFWKFSEQNNHWFFCKFLKNWQVISDRISKELLVHGRFFAQLQIETVCLIFENCMVMSQNWSLILRTACLWVKTDSFFWGLPGYGSKLILWFLRTAQLQIETQSLIFESIPSNSLT